MILNGKCIFVTIFSFIVISAQDASLSTIKKSYKVRVLLADTMADNTFQWHVKTTDGVVFVDPERPTNKLTYKKNNLDITYKDGHWLINNKKFNTAKVCIIPQKSHLDFNDNSYAGAFLLTCQDKKLYLINIVDLEQYVYCVLRTESWPGWPLEVNKVFAIACRTYALHMITNYQLRKVPYHIKNSNVHQTYKGMHARNDLKEAVDETRGIFLAHNNKPIIAMFDICCGGIIPSLMQGIDFIKAPYLARNYACTHCKRCKVFNWKAQYSLGQLEKILKQEIKPLKRLKTVKINKKDKATLIEEVMFVGSSGWHPLSIKKMYSLLKDSVKSYCFSVAVQGQNVVFSGNGFGHHLGMCQWGAREMIRDGWKFDQVLNFYYPGTRFMRLH